MKLSVSPYRLLKKPLGSVNARDTAIYQEGALLRFQQGEDWGVADICPRTELGDDPWQKQISDRGFLFLRAMELALEDMLARKNAKSLLSYRQVRNNYLVTDYKAENLNQARYAEQTVKLKADRDIESMAAVLNGIHIPVRIRLDFNSCLEASLFEKFLGMLNDTTRKKIEYIEDPTPYTSEWRGWNIQIPLAFDFQQAEYKSDWASYRILKPVRERIPPDYDMSRITLTSAMDHPVGIAHGLRLAQQCAQTDSGFLTLSLYEETPFHRFFVQKENMLTFSEAALGDTGIGMTEELNRINWREL